MLGVSEKRLLSSCVLINHLSVMYPIAGMPVQMKAEINYCIMFS